MFIEFDTTKDATNRERHGLSLALAEDFDWASELVVPANTVAGETRWKILATVNGSVYAGVFVIRNERPRVISVRHASRKERKEYGLRQRRNRGR